MKIYCRQGVVFSRRSTPFNNIYAKSVCLTWAVISGGVRATTPCSVTPAPPKTTQDHPLHRPLFHNFYVPR